MTKQPRLELPKYLDTVRNHVTHCVKCGTTEKLEVAHYSGLYADRLGKGMGSKCHDYAVARLCRDCHTKLDSYAEGNDEQRAMDFIWYIYQTMRIMALAEQNTTPTPKDLAALPWLTKTTIDLMWLITSDADGIDADLLIDFLAQQRNDIAGWGK